jgi:hypothetical protein
MKEDMNEAGHSRIPSAFSFRAKECYHILYSTVSHIWGSVFIGRIYHKNIYDMMAFTERKIGYPSSTFVWYFSVAPSIVVVLRANSEKFHILNWLVMVENAYKHKNG